MIQRLRPECCLAILVGASKWPGARTYNPAPEFAASAKGFRDYCRSPEGLGIPNEQTLYMFDTPDSAESQLATIRRFLRTHVEARERGDQPFTDLFLYAVSHGEGTRQNPRDLHLIVQTTEERYVDGTGLSVRQLAATLALEAKTLRRYVILDCCFSGAALAHFQSRAENASIIVATDFRRSVLGSVGPERSLIQIVQTLDSPPNIREQKNVPEGSDHTGKWTGYAPKAGTILLCSSRADDLSLARARDGRTVFTSSMLRVLGTPVALGSVRQRDLIPDLAMISFSDLRDRTWDIIASEFGENAPYPQLYAPSQQPGDLSVLALLPIKRGDEPSGTQTDKKVGDGVDTKQEEPKKPFGWRVLAGGVSLILSGFVYVMYLVVPPPPNQVTRVGFESVAGNDHSKFGRLTEEGFTVIATSSNWLVGRTYGNPPPYIFFLEQGNGGQRGLLTITANGADFAFKSIDLYSSITGLEYLFVGMKDGQEVFREAGQIGHTFGQFATVKNRASNTMINALEIVVRSNIGDISSNIENPVGIDNIVTVKSSSH